MSSNRQSPRDSLQCSVSLEDRVGLNDTPLLKQIQDLTRLEAVDNWRERILVVAHAPSAPPQVAARLLDALRPRLVVGVITGADDDEAWQVIARRHGLRCWHVDKRWEPVGTCLALARYLEEDQKVGHLVLIGVDPIAPAIDYFRLRHRRGRVLVAVPSSAYAAACEAGADVVVDLDQLSTVMGGVA